MDSTPPILPLPAEAIAQIKSSIAITSLNAVVIELVKNSLDARSDKIEVGVEYCRGNCVIEDDGIGIPPPEFKEGGGLGKLHHTSKTSCSTITYGSHGAFLASVAALSLMSITSHHYLHHSHNSLTINRSQVIARHTPAPPQQHNYAHKHGTRVTVHDLFGNMPVRVKQRIGESNRLSKNGREWEELRKLVASLVLAWPSPVLVVVRNGISGQKMQLRGARPLSSLENTQNETKLVRHVCSTLSQAMLIALPDQSKWVSIKASTPRIRLRGAISREPAPTKAVQFLSLGIEPLSIQYGHSFLYDEINRLFESSFFGNEGESSDVDAAEIKRKYEDGRYRSDNFTTKELRGSRKGFDRWPMFFIQIEFLDPAIHRPELTAGDLVNDKKGSLNTVMELLQAMILEFLRSHHFQPKSTGIIHFPEDEYSEIRRSLPKRHVRVSRGTDLRPQSLKLVQTQRIGSPFNTWSRVKSGKPKPAISKPEHFSESMKLAIKKPNETRALSENTSKIQARSMSSSDRNSRSLTNDTSTIARSGRVIRPPFDGLQLALTNAASAPTKNKNKLSASESKTVDDEDTVVDWFNPVTRKGSLVNSRTGLVTQSSKTGRLTPRILSYLEPESDSCSSISERLAFTRHSESNARSSTWINDIFQNWNNPVYRPTEASIPQVSTKGPRNESQQLLHGYRHSCLPLDISRAFQETSAGLAGRISKKALRQADVISQVDSKFILIKILASSVSSGDTNTSAPTEMLVIVDQHAADERCRIEDLLGELCNAPLMEERLGNVASVQPGVLTTLLETPISFIIPGREVQLLRTHSQHFADWGIIYDLPPVKPETEQHQEHKITVRSLPPSIAERCKTMPKLLVELIRSEAWSYSDKEPKLGVVSTEADGSDNNIKHPWLRKIHGCPQALLEMLHSRACRSAIMFNDELSNDQCCAIISRLAECAFPFQCAHGRPSMVPLLNLESFKQWNILKDKADVQHERHFSTALRRWKHGMAGVIEG